jgi:hypothetical protein
VPDDDSPGARTAGVDAPEPPTPLFLRHPFEEGSLECPRDFVVTTIFAARTKDKEFAPNVVVTRDRLRQNESEATYVGRQLVELSRNLKKFKLHGRKDLAIGGRPAHQIACGWLGAQGPVEQLITMVIREDHALTFTTTVPKARSEQLLPTFERILASVEIKD